MESVNFKEQNSTLTKEDCLDLPACYIDNQIISCWKLSFKERLKVLFGSKVWLHVQGSKHPPVYLDIKNPFKK